MQCEYCQREIQNAGCCPDCGTALYTARGRIIYGSTAKDSCGCETTITEKYLIIRKESGAESKATRVGQSFGLLGVFATEIARGVKTRPHGFYELSRIQKGIFPYMTNGIKKKNAIKLINNDGTDFILIFDKPGTFDSVWKALKVMVEKITAAIPVVEDGSNKNFGNVHCSNPFVNHDNFDKIKPGHTADISNNKVHTSSYTTQSETTHSVKRPDSKPAESQSTTYNVNQQTVPTKIRCPQCGTYVFNGNKFCNECGNKLEYEIKAVKKCLRCGEPLNDGDKFCSQCGYENKTIVRNYRQ